MDFDEVLGLRLTQDVGRRTQEKIRKKYKFKQRETLRQEKKFVEADEARKGIEEKGYMIEDT